MIQGTSNKRTEGTVTISVTGTGEELI